MANDKLLVIIPCFNEEDSIARVLTEIASLGMNYETIVIDDGSTDNTYPNSVKQSRTIKLMHNLGIGGSVQTGIKYALENGYRFCVQIDGDGQHMPCQIGKLIEQQKKTSASIVIGSRYIKNDTFRSTLARRIGSAAIALTLNVLFKESHITDPTSGMRLMDVKSMAMFSKKYPHDYPEPISLAWALNAGMKVSECSVEMRMRDNGKSSISGIKPFLYMIRVIAYIILERISGRRIN